MPYFRLRIKWTALNIFLVSLSNIFLVCPNYIFLMCPIIECLQVSLCNLSIIHQLLTNKSVNQIHDTLSIVNMPGRYMLLSECGVNPYRGEIDWFIFHKWIKKVSIDLFYQINLSVSILSMKFFWACCVLIFKYFTMITINFDLFHFICRYHST